MKFSKSLHLILFFIAMAMLESAVVIYLRELYYPSGFSFPLRGMKDIVIFTELAREFATIVMLWTIAFVAGRNFSTRFAWFIIGFGIWDIFYYVFLYVFIQWPSSLLDWDILFLIPLPWYGPVIAPCIISLLMILLGCLILFHSKHYNLWHWYKFPVVLLLFGCVLSLYTFIYPFWNSLSFENFISIKQAILEHSQSFVPVHYDYSMITLAMILSSLGIFLLHYWNKKK